MTRDRIREMTDMADNVQRGIAPPSREELAKILHDIRRGHALDHRTRRLPDAAEKESRIS